jgi:hypothetical protein
MKQGTVSVLLILAVPAFARLRRGRQLFPWLAVVFYVGGSVSAFSQGSLTPPGAPAPTMKTLTQVEPRTDLATLPGDADSMFIVTTPGSYYLSGNLSVTKPHGIKVSAADVTIDFNGFAVTRATGSGGNAVFSSTSRCTVRNGTIDGNFLTGVEMNGSGNACLHLTVNGSSDFGIFLGETAQVDHCKVHNSAGGIFVGDGSTISHCAVAHISRDNGYDLGAACTLTDSTAFHCTGPAAIYAAGGNSILHNCATSGNSVTQGVIITNSATLTDCSSTGDDGPNGILAQGPSNLTNCSVRGFGTDDSKWATAIGAGPGSTLNGCSANENKVADGIIAQGGSTLTNCTANGNSSTTSASSGITVGASSTLINCTAQNNTNPGASYSTGIGIYLATGSTMQNCVASSNTADGIRAESRCVISNSTAWGNGGPIIGSGFSVGDDVVISSCTTTANRAHGLTAGKRCKLDNVNANGNGNGTIGSGISTDARAMVKNCCAADNRKSGIIVLSESIVVDCRGSHNGLGGPAAGIDSSSGSGSRLEGNQARDNTGTGILASSGDIVIRNSAGANTVANFNPSSGPNFGAIQTPSSATNPMANINF